jgi:hypothetical protein
VADQRAPRFDGDEAAHVRPGRLGQQAVFGAVYATLADVDVAEQLAYGISVGRTEISDDHVGTPETTRSGASR